MTPGGTISDVPTALSRLTAYCLPGGEAAARGVRGIRATQRGEIRSGPDARWIPFTAEEFVDAASCAFCWDARMGQGLVTSVRVTDAYEDGHGRLVLSKGPIQLKKLVGPDVDKGELQRYLGYVGYCPAMLVNNPALEFEPTGPLTIRVRSRSVSDVAVEMEIDPLGRPVVTRAMRPMTVGKQSVVTPWSAVGTDPEVHEGLRVWRHMEAFWEPPTGSFSYVRIELRSVTVLR